MKRTSRLPTKQQVLQWRRINLIKSLYSSSITKLIKDLKKIIKPQKGSKESVVIDKILKLLGE